MRIRSQSDFWCGLLFIAIGVGIMVLARNYRIGTAARMGPGYFPELLGTVLSCLGLSLTIPALFINGDAFPKLHFRALAMILMSIVIFGVTLDYLGFAVAVVLLVAIGGIADPALRPVESAALALFLVIFSALIFVVLLGLPLSLWPNL